MFWIHQNRTVQLSLERERGRDGMRERGRERGREGERERERERGREREREGSTNSDLFFFITYYL